MTSLSCIVHTKKEPPMILVCYSWRHSRRAENFIISQTPVNPVCRNSSTRRRCNETYLRRQRVRNVRRRNDNSVPPTYLPNVPSLL